MSSARLRLALALLAVAAALLFLVRPPAAPETRPPAAASSATAAPTPAAVSTPAPHAAAAAPVTDPSPDAPSLTRLAYSQAWDGPLPPAMAAFRAWTQRHRTAPSLPARLALEPEGVALARARRAEMRELIVRDPARALAVTVPATVRQSLPTAVLTELETRHAGRGDYALQASSPAPGEPPHGPALRRIVFLGGVTFTAHTYGRRTGQLTEEGASLHGIALDRALALHESPVRLLEPGEIPGAAAEPACIGCAALLPPDDATTGVNLVELDTVAAEGRILRVHPAELAALEARAIAAEDAPGPRVAPLASLPTVSPADLPSPTSAVPPPRAADAPTPHTVGTKQILVIRTDFSDFPGEPISEAAATTLMDGAVKTQLEDMSYGLTSSSVTVSSKTYRLPRTGASYATTNDRNPLHADARTLAAADYTLSTYDRIIVLFPNIGTTRVPGSQITFGGLANVVGTNAWINGPNSFGLATLVHELGHTYGLLHANLWRVRDGNALSADGNTLEYGDPFDLMGSSSATGVTRDARHHFSMWGKNRLGWLPDDAVTTVTRSGIYRVHRFDARNAPRNQPLALRVFRDGVRWYWIGLRQNFATGTLRADGAYVIWGHNQRLQTQLLDLNTPGGTGTANGTGDAALPVGATFRDPQYGIALRTVARGGEAPSEWLDIEVTLPDLPRNVVTAWGREGSTFYDTETGEDLVPAPETNVPMNLENVKAIAAGDLHALALRHDGTVVAWGSNANGQTTVPAGLADVVAIAAGGHVSGAVLADGTVRLWGPAASGILTPPASVRDIRQLAIGSSTALGIYHALALRADGTIVAWGDNTRGQATVPTTVTRASAIAASDRLSVALRPDGTVVRWGTTFADAVPFPANLSDVTAIASSGNAAHVLALKRDGTVVGWGVNLNNRATPPAGLTDVVALAAGAAHSLALKRDGTVVAWGNTALGRTAIPPSLPAVRAIAASGGASFALVGTPAGFSVQPQSQTVAAGGSATFRTEVTGATGTVGYQWRRNGIALAGATAATLTIPRVSAIDIGTYDVVVATGGGTIASATARLSVPGASAADLGRIANLSIRTAAGTGDSTLIVGVGIGGPNTGGPKAVLLRGVGPTLAAFGVGGALADPVMTVFQGTTQVAANDDWAGGFDFATLGAFAFSGANPRDAALYNPAAASGSYSIQIVGKNNATGIALAEVYDATPPASFTTATPRLVNVSARTQVGTGENILIAGFVVAGTSPVRVLVRAIGPTLAAFGVGGTLADPRLELLNAAGTRVAENDNWGGSIDLKAAFAAVGAFALTPDNSRDAAVLVSLPPGTYTAQISGVGATSGVALVEVYEIP